jgi:hypothetical protein
MNVYEQSSLGMVEGLGMMRWRAWIAPTALILLLASLVVATAAAQIAPVEQLVFDTRNDLEVLADANLGAGTRPPNWSGNTDVNSATVVTDLWFDNELLANILFGEGVRPESWIGATAPVAAVLARNVRHDLELSADEQFGIGERPQEWRGSAPVVRCERDLQNVLNLLDTFYSLETNVAESTFNYCQAIIADIEDNLTNIYFGTQVDDQPLVDPLELVLAVRGDLERLADEELGLNNRPQGWIGNRDRSSTTLIGDTFVDLQLLADELLGAQTRPDGWIGAVAISPASSYFSLRHDLELLTDTAYARDTRPNGWQGLLPLARCEPLTQQLIFIAGIQYEELNLEGIDPQAPDYCVQASNAANLLVENPPAPEIVEGEEGLDDPRIARSLIAFTYLDVAATQYMGMMPQGTQFRALYRNFNTSNMLFVTGEDFAVYIDLRWTDMPESVYRSLPTLEGVVPISFCQAAWCSGPGPTPTPTGGGPLVALLFQTTPQATPNADTISITKTQISWTNVRVTYLADNAGTGSAQVTLEVCAQPAEVATACEPVTRVFDNGTGTERAVLGQSNGLNIYELRYGYTTDLLIEGETRFSTDVWISDPTIR